LSFGKLRMIALVLNNRRSLGLRMLIMMGIRCQCYRKLLALSIKRLRLSFQRSRL